MRVVTTARPSHPNGRPLTQVMPATAAELGVSNRIHLYDAEVSLRTGSRYFRQMQDLFPGRLDLALAGL